MTFRTIAAAIAMPIALVLATPAMAQSMSYTYGDYWEVANIQVDDGANAQYLDYLAANWKKSQEFAKSKGWIKAYHVLANMHKRSDEADYYLVTVFSHMADAKEAAERDVLYEAYMKSDQRKMEAESGGRAKYRKVLGSSLMGELLLK